MLMYLYRELQNLFICLQSITLSRDLLVLNFTLKYSYEMSSVIGIIVQRKENIEGPMYDMWSIANISRTLTWKSFNAFHT